MKQKRVFTWLKGNQKAKVKFHSWLDDESSIKRHLFYPGYTSILTEYNFVKCTNGLLVAAIHQWCDDLNDISEHVFLNTKNKYLPRCTMDQLNFAHEVTQVVVPSIEMIDNLPIRIMSIEAIELILEGCRGNGSISKFIHSFSRATRYDIEFIPVPNEKIFRMKTNFYHEDSGVGGGIYVSIKKTNTYSSPTKRALSKNFKT